jgi:predicted secreted Zn-dependent protease
MSVLTNRLFCLAGLLIVTLSFSLVHAEPIVVEETNYYKITGFSERGLLDQMNALGPKPYHGYTQSPIRYHFRSRNVVGGCVITSCIVSVHVTYTMPKWTNKSDGPLALQGKWDKYYRCLNTHEIGHKDIAVRNARLIEQSLIGLQGATGQEVANRAEEIARQYIEKAKQEDAEYDRVTGHGRSQGAHFP